MVRKSAASAWSVVWGICFVSTAFFWFGVSRWAINSSFASDTQGNTRFSIYLVTLLGLTLTFVFHLIGYYRLGSLVLSSAIKRRAIELCVLASWMYASAGFSFADHFIFQESLYVLSTALSSVAGLLYLIGGIRLALQAGREASTPKTVRWLFRLVAAVWALYLLYLPLQNSTQMLPPAYLTYWTPLPAISLVCAGIVLFLQLEE